MEAATEAMLPALIAELDHADDEHPDVSVEDESGWGLSAFPSGHVIWENVEDDSEPRHMRGLSREAILELFTMLLRQDLGAIEAQPWDKGYGG